MSKEKQQIYAVAVVILEGKNEEGKERVTQIVTQVNDARSEAEALGVAILECKEQDYDYPILTHVVLPIEY